MFQRSEGGLDARLQDGVGVERVVEGAGGVGEDEAVGGDLGDLEDGGMDGGAGKVKVGGGDDTASALVVAEGSSAGGGGVAGAGEEGEGLVDGVEEGKDVVEGVEADVQPLGAAAGGGAGLVRLLAAAGSANGLDGDGAGAHARLARGGGLLPQLEENGVLVASRQRGQRRDVGLLCACNMSI